MRTMDLGNLSFWVEHPSDNDIYFYVCSFYCEIDFRKRGWVRKHDPHLYGFVWFEFYIISCLNPIRTLCSFSSISWEFICVPYVTCDILWFAYCRSAVGSRADVVCIFWGRFNVGSNQATLLKLKSTRFQDSIAPVYIAIGLQTVTNGLFVCEFYL